jgi:hypothetical protein
MVKGVSAAEEVKIFAEMFDVCRVEQAKVIEEQSIRIGACLVIGGIELDPVAGGENDNLVESPSGLWKVSMQALPGSWPSAGDPLA